MTRKECSSLMSAVPASRVRMLESGSLMSTSRRNGETEVGAEPFDSCLHRPEHAEERNS
jgi:hypothetical protein